MRIIVYHRSYGCDTGCCGHVIAMADDAEFDDDYDPLWDGRSLTTSREGFSFAHPIREDLRMFAEGLVREEFGDEHVADLDWDKCYVSDDDSRVWWGAAA
jgi:hypothetical protein